MRNRMVIRAGWVALLACAIGLLPAMAQPCPRDRAMWIYQCPYDVVRDRGERDAVFPFALSHGIKDFFVWVRFTCDPSGDRCSLEGSDYRAALRLLIRKAHHRNIRVHALHDDARLALVANHNRALAIVQATLDFNDRGEPDQRFDGLHLDVEPHTLSDYQRNPLRTIQEFLDMNTIVSDALARGGLSYGVDVVEFWHPYWDERGRFVDRPELLMEYGGRQDYPTMHLMNIVKEVVIMSYHRNPDAIRRKTEYVMAYAAQPEVGARVYVGVQTSPPLPDPRCSSRQQRACSETFGCGTRSAMEDALCIVDSALAGFDSFAGFSYFKYSSYRDMME